MWSFFGLLFFGGFYLYKKIEDDVEKELDIRAFEKSWAVNKKLTMDMGEESKYSRRFRRDRESFIEELSEIEADMIYIFGEDWHDIIRNYYEYDELYENPIGIAWHVFLAHMGYLDHISCLTYHFRADAYFEQRFKGLCVMERCMRAAHPDLDLELIVCPDSKFDMRGRVKYNNDIHSCAAKWKHMINRPYKEYAKHFRKLSEIDIDL